MPNNAITLKFPASKEDNGQGLWVNDLKKGFFGCSNRRVEWCEGYVKFLFTGETSYRYLKEKYINGGFTKSSLSVFVEVVGRRGRGGGGGNLKPELGNLLDVSCKNSSKFKLLHHSRFLAI